MNAADAAYTDDKTVDGGIGSWIVAVAFERGERNRRNSLRAILAQIHFIFFLNSAAAGAAHASGWV